MKIKSLLPLLIILIQLFWTPSARGQVAEVVFRNSDYPALQAIYSIAVDNVGNVYLAGSDSEFSLGSLVKVYPDGQIQVLLQDGIGADGFISLFFSKIKFDDLQNIYVTGSNASIFRITPNNEVETAFIKSDVPNGINFDTVTDYEVDDLGTLFVADRANSQVLKITLERNVSVAISAAGIQGTPFGSVSRLAIDSSNNLYASSQPFGAPELNAVFKLTPEGVLSTVLDTNTSMFQSAWGITVDNFDNVFIPDRDTGRVFKIDKSGNVSLHYAYTGSVLYLNELLMDNWGNAYFPAIDGGIYRLNQDRTLTNLGTLNNFGIYSQTLDSWGNLYGKVDFTEGSWVYRIRQPSAAPPITRFDPTTGILTIPYLNIGNGVEYSNVELKLNAAGAFDIVGGQEISISAINEYFSVMMKPVEATIPLCSNGETATYDGSGSNNKSANYSCN